MIVLEVGKAKTSKKFEAVMAWVAVNYSKIYHLPEVIRLDSAACGGGANGMYNHEGTRRVVIIRERRGPYAEYRMVRTLVHELTHALQHSEGRPGTESEAHVAGSIAANKFQAERRG